MQRLHVTSREFAATADWSALDHLPESPLVFLKNGAGLVGFGTALKLTARGENRMTELATAWREVCANAQIDDAVKSSGSGLVAFGSMAFADDSESESVLIVPQVVLGNRDGRTWFSRIGASLVEDESLPSFAAEIQQYAPAVRVNFEDASFAAPQFMAAVEDAVAHIKAHDIDKVVLARDIRADLPADFDIRANLVRLAKRFSSTWIYSVDGTFGASPELLVRVALGQVSARVLAGTAGRGTEPSIDAAISKALASSGKNRSEHGFAVDSLVKSLSPYCEAIEADAEPFSLALPNLWHLASDVQGVLRESASSLDLAAALHPTAAVAGTPTELAKAMIAELEPFDRGRYAGPVGWLDASGDGEWVIALRGGQLGAGSVTAYAGCGIVAESDPEAELAETELKFSPIRSAFA
ncbi:MAG: hypothetical protein RL605_666 [Actinomycetota bacterium]|jgi:menaquinone-specific isochorismate synthase